MSCLPVPPSLQRCWRVSRKHPRTPLVQWTALSSLRGFGFCFFSICLPNVVSLFIALEVGKDVIFKHNSDHTRVTSSTKMCENICVGTKSDNFVVDEALGPFCLKSPSRVGLFSCPWKCDARDLCLRKRVCCSQPDSTKQRFHVSPGQSPRSTAWPPQFVPRPQAVNANICDKQTGSGRGWWQLPSTQLHLYFRKGLYPQLICLPQTSAGSAPTAALPALCRPLSPSFPWKFHPHKGLDGLWVWTRVPLKVLLGLPGPFTSPWATSV